MFSSIGNFAHKYRFFYLGRLANFNGGAGSDRAFAFRSGRNRPEQVPPVEYRVLHRRRLLNNKFVSISADTSNKVVVIYNESGFSKDDLVRSNEVRDWLDSRDAAFPQSTIAPGK